MWFQKKKTIVVHSDTYHSDDVFACAVLSLYFKKHNTRFRIIRSRDPQVISAADIVVDVGGVYDPANNRFDHHQTEGAGTHDNGIPYASFGLVWKHFGLDVCDGNTEVFTFIEERMVYSVDALDNGVAITTPIFTNIMSYDFHSVISAFQPSWKESDAILNPGFYKSLVLAEEILAREVKKGIDLKEGEALVEQAYQSTHDKRLIVLDHYYPWKKQLSLHPEPLFVVWPKHDGSAWNIGCVRNDLSTFTNRKDLPAAWAGLRDAELQKITGVTDAVFCHRRLFLAVTKSKEGALKLAELALAS